MPTAIILQFVSTFGVWMLAERIGLSGVLTMVCFAITVARTAPERTPARIRIPSYAVWETVVFVLNILAFIFIGLQIRPDHGRPGAGRARAATSRWPAPCSDRDRRRMAWHMSFNAVVRWRDRRFGFHPPRPMLRPTVGSGLVISWAGMRGIVTLAAALALPAAFPFRELIVLTAFAVVLGTLSIQGLTLKPLLRALDLQDDDPVGRESAPRANARCGPRSATLRGRRLAASPRRCGRSSPRIWQRGPGDGPTRPGERAHGDSTGRPSMPHGRPCSRCATSDEIGDDAFHRSKRSSTGSRWPAAGTR